jgi:hypothetical protein
MEIFQNTIFKLVFRQGSDLDRKSIVLGSGEPGYSVDTQRLYIGNGSLSGGNIVGNIFQGSDNPPTTFTNSVVGDLTYYNDLNKLYRLKYSSNISNLSSWELVGGVYSSNDPHINVSNDNKLSLNPLSAYTLDKDLIKGPIILDSGKIGLSSKIPFSAVSTNTITVSSGLIASINGTNVTNIAINPLSSNLLIQSNQLYTRYNGVTQSTVFTKGITSQRLSAGHYKFTFQSLPTSNFIATTQIFGLSALGYDSRPTSTSVSSCYVEILSSNGSKTDAEVMLLINY